MGNTNTTKVINNTSEDVKIRVLPGYPNPPKDYDIKAREQRDINGAKFDGSNILEKLATVMIYCDGRSLLSESGKSALAGEDYFGYKTVTIAQVQGDQNSTGRVKYEVRFDGSRKKSDKNIIKVMITLDPSKLFSSNIVKDPETSLLRMVLDFWPRTFTNLNSEDDLKKTVGVVNELMVQAKKYNALMVLAKEYSTDRSTGEVAKEMDKVMEKVMENQEKVKEKVKEKVSELNNLCAAKEEWYHPLFQGIRFQPPMAQVDQVNLKNFETAIKDKLQPTAAELLALKEQLKARIN